MEKKYFIVTYGCQMNVHESEKLSGMLREMGYIGAKDEADADLVVFNTCCVRENAENHAYGNIGNMKKLKKEKPDMIVAVCGCMTQQISSAEKLRESFPYVDIVLGTFNMDRFKDLLKEKLESKKAVFEVLDKNGGITEGVKPFRSSFPNAWVNIMYGCNNFCSYCVVPYVRGRERSRKTDNVYSEVSDLVKQGYKEITLLGQNVNSYGNDLKDGTNFASLLNKLSDIDGKYRLRFISSHPKDLTEDVVRAIAANEHVCHAIHLPVQSGSDRILKLMNRHYTREEYLDKIKFIKSVIPDCAVTTDIIVGFPTETEEDFQDTVSLIKQADFAGAFTFVYSPREGTKAAAMEGQISDEVKKDRIMRLVEFQNNLNRGESKNYNGKTVEILCEDFDEKKETYTGRDEYGRMAYFPYKTNIIGKFVNVKITAEGGISLMGEVVGVID